MNKLDKMDSLFTGKSFFYLHESNFSRLLYFHILIKSEFKKDN